MDAAEQTGADKALIEDKYAIAEIQTRETVKQAKLALAGDFFKSVTGLLGKESKAGKGFAIAGLLVEKAAAVSKIIANTAIANAKAAAASPVTLGQPFVTINSIAAGLGISSAVAATAKGIGQISGATPKAAKGMTLQGNRHSAGGINLFDGSGSPVVNAEDGENIYVINRNASALINGLSNVNQLTGGGAVINSCKLRSRWRTGTKVDTITNRGINI